nr:heavy-metal-associated domain-containing protein [candidate division Zixibacteria bacterium]
MNNTIKISVSGMHCGGCTNSVRMALEKINGVVSVRVDQATGTAEIDYKDQKPETDDLVGAVERAGFKAVLPV